MFTLTSRRFFRLFLAILSAFSLIGLWGSPYDLRAFDSAPKPLELTQASLNAPIEPVFSPEGPTMLEDQNLLLVAPYSGPLTAFGLESKRGAEMALKAWGAGFNLEQADEEERVETQIPNLKDVKVALGHFSEKSLARNAPYYIHYQIPVLLPYLENPEVASLNENFFQLMPDFGTQGRRLAQEILTQKKKPNQVVILVGPERPQRLLADAFATALAKGLTLPASGQSKTSKRIGALPSKVKVHRLEIDTLGGLAELKDLKGGSQDIVLLALPLSLALEAGPILAESKFSKARFLAGSALGLRELGAEYNALKLSLSLCLPVVPAPKSAAYNTFARRYEYYAKSSPTWPAVLAYDATTMAIKAASLGNVKEYLLEPDRPHQGLTTSYVFNKGAPTQIFKVSADSLSFLP
ncbi:MAG: hypothetical protein LBS60_15080 [Deltaproteobacteria bacterium]|jgi:ABC-type branched-subunit amino acid transport system substrate-binding protein|nr:hypothetical protein [Deltaproteobacteria bacterium]